MHYVQRDIPCQRRFEETLRDRMFSFMARPCKMNTDPLPRFYMLADSEARDSIFVLFPAGPRNVVKLTTRISDVGALMYPSTVQSPRSDASTSQ